MADGYTKVSGKPGVCGVSGVGATNMVQGIIESYLSSTPVVLLVEEGSGTTRHRNDLQDIDRGPIFASITKWVGQLEVPARIPDLIAHGFRVATTGRPGPVYIGCPWDVVSSEPVDVPLLELAAVGVPGRSGRPRPTARRECRAPSPLGRTPGRHRRRRRADLRAEEEVLALVRVARGATGRHTVRQGGDRRGRRLVRRRRRQLHERDRGRRRHSAQGCPQGRSRRPHRHQDEFRGDGELDAP